MRVGDRLETIGGAADRIVEALRPDRDAAGHRYAADERSGLLEIYDGFADEAGMDSQIATRAQRPQGGGRYLAEPRLYRGAVADPARDVVRDRLGRWVRPRVGQRQKRLFLLDERGELGKGDAREPVHARQPR